jgi:hypothetical protein
MDEASFRSTREAARGPACVFEKALLARCADCRHAARLALAEREAIGCRAPAARTDCAALMALLRERAAFALKRRLDAAPLPHALALRLQCGGVRGLAHAVDAVAADDVSGLVAAAQARYGALADLPWPPLVAAVAAWQGRPPGRVRR